MGGDGFGAWAENAIGGGGRYDNLVESLGGRPTPGVGFGSGLERLLDCAGGAGGEVAGCEEAAGVAGVSWGGGAEAQWKLLRELRANEIAADMDHSGRSVKGQFKLLDRSGARWAVTIGETELANDTVVVKDLEAGEQVTVGREEVVGRFRG